MMHNAHAAAAASTNLGLGHTSNPLSHYKTEAEAVNT